MRGGQAGTFGRRLGPDEAIALGYVNLAIRADDGTVQSMETADGYRVSYGAPSYSSAVLAAKVMSARQGQDRNGLGATPASAVGAADLPDATPETTQVQP